MATTSTNKQPLLVDRLLHYVASTSTAFNDGINPSTNAAIMLVDSTTADGAIIEDIFRQSSLISCATYWGCINNDVISVSFCVFTNKKSFVIINVHSFSFQ